MFGPGVGSIGAQYWWLSVFHSFDEVDVDLSAGGVVGRGDRQWHSERSSPSWAVKDTTTLPAGMWL